MNILGTVWKPVLVVAALVLLLVAIGPVGREHVVGSLSGFGSDPLGTLQGLAVRAGPVALALGAIAHFTPWTRNHGQQVIEGVLIGLAAIFVGIPLLVWVLTHLHEIGNFVGGLAG